MSAPTIVLATDFGLADPYVGMMRGVIRSINPAAHVIDLAHGINPQDVRHGAYVLADAWRYFPEGSIFVAVVDPGVGTRRAALLLETPGARFIAPDNGLLTLICQEHDPAFGNAVEGGDAAQAIPTAVPVGCRARHLANPRYWRSPVSATFHGRDVFSPVAAHLAGGVDPDRLGEPVSHITALALPAPRREGQAITGQVIYADGFGNLVTDLTGSMVDPIIAAAGSSDTVTVAIGDRTLTGLARTFHDPPGAGLRALIGSHGRLEIALVDGSAAATLQIGGGAPVTIAATTAGPTA